MPSSEELLARIAELEGRLADAEDALDAIHSGDVDALMIGGHLYVVNGADAAYRLLLENMKGGAVTFSADGTVLYANRQFAGMLGRELSRIVGARAASLFHPSSADVAMAILGGDTPVMEMEGQLAHADGSAVPAFLAVNAFSLGDQRVTCLVAADLREQKRTEQILKAESFARAILESAPAATVVADGRGRVVRANQAARDLAGGRLLGAQFDEVFSLRFEAGAPTGPAHRSLPEAIRADGAASGIPARLDRKDGKHFDLLVSFGKLDLPDGGLAGGVITLADVGPLLRAREALWDSRFRLQLAIDSAGIGIFEWNMATQELIWDQRTYECWGLTVGTPLSLELFLRGVHPDDRTRVETAIERLRDPAGNGKYRVEHRVVGIETGVERWVEVHGQMLFDQGRPARFFGMVIDVSERRRIEEQLRQAQKMESIGVLAGGIAHDFNNILTGVLGNASLLLEDLPRRDKNRPLAEALIFSAERAADLTRQLLAYAGKGRFLIGPVDLSESAREISELMRGSVPASIALDLDLQEKLPAVEADHGQIQQILMNLVLNASEAIGNRPGRIQIRTRSRSVDEAVIQQAHLDIPVGTYVALEIRDTGDGMDPDIVARIFEPFFTTKFTGRGLGLAAVHGIVRAHKGAVLVYSNPGQGSVFTVLLPASPVAAVPKAEISFRPAAVTGHGTILVVDDEETVRSVAKLTLERAGYQVLLAENGVEALTLFQENPGRFLLVLLDLTMPLMSGEETLKRLRAVQPEVRVLLSSGYDQIDVFKRFAGQGLAGFIGKPYSAAALLSAVKAATEPSVRSAPGN